MDIEELKSLSYYFSGSIKFQQSSLEMHVDFGIILG
jgi:hypothetical protein